MKNTLLIAFLLWLALRGKLEMPKEEGWEF